MQKGIFMGKYFVLFAAALVAAGCNSQEQEAQIQEFWMAQGLYIAQKVGGPYAALAASAGSAPRSNVVLPEDVNKEFETAMQPEMTPEQQ